jgi:subtilisin-like proprotein convertase family protein
MTTPFISKYFLLYLLFFFSICSFSQTESQKKDILNQYNVTKLKQLQLRLTEETKKNKERALFLAKINNWDTIKKQEDGSFDELVGLLSNGSPKYFSLNNLNAAISTRANLLQTGGLLGLNLNGQEMLGGVWDGGPVRTSHQEFNGRMIVGDGVTQLNGNSFHATHVSGTVGATGINPEAKGMAFQSTVRTFDWNNDESEVLSEILNNGLLLSNHSYGIRLSNVPSWYAGAYSQDAVQWDNIHYLAPYYLMVVSAGNDGNATNENPTTTGFDKLTGNKNAKNNLVIANAQDAIIDSQGNLISVSINSGSSEGPTDDLRIKPDITGNGTNVFSTNSSGDQEYTTLSGTSMSGPNVMGTLMLLQQHHQNLYQRFMKSSTLKGLACHTADDSGNPGPDPVFGWGLLNAKKAANAITNNGLNNWITEEKIAQNQVYTKTVKSIPGEPLIATICWTDIPGIANTGTLNDTTPALVHDLDIRISQGSLTFFPWRLPPNANFQAIRNGDNFVDTVETVRVENPNGGEYTITITHKESLQTESQDYSLIISGIDSDFGITPLGYDQTVCSTDNATFSFSFINNSNVDVSFNVIDLPNGAVAEFSSPSLNSNGVFDLSFSNLTAVEPGIYNIGVEATNENETETRYIKLRVLSANFQVLNPLLPINGASNINKSVLLNWEDDVNAENYLVEISTDVNFNSLLFTTSTENNSVLVTDLSGQTVYYWRVKPINRCGEASTTFFSTFQTGIFECDVNFAASDFSNSLINNTANSIATVPINIEGNITISNITVALNITHSWVQDLTILLIGPPEIGSPTITLFEEPCGGEDNIVVTLDDSGENLICGSNPAISGNIKPKSSFFPLIGLPAEGIWTLYVIDKYNSDGGTINAVNLNFCNAIPIENNLSLTNNGIITEINSTKIILSEELNAETNGQNPFEQVYTLIEAPTLGTLKNQGVDLFVGATFSQDDVNLNRISYSNSETQSSNDSFKVTILNATNSWLPNVIIPITIQNSLSLGENRSDEILVYPNPSKGNVTISTFDNDKTIINVFDIQGRIIMSKKELSNIIFLDLNTFSDGVYFISIQHKNMKMTKKLILKKE